MKKTATPPKNESATQKGYNEKNPAQPHGAFPPASDAHDTRKEAPKSNTADKKKKEEEN